MIQLEKTLLIGKGLHRECYCHPHDPALCVKVVYNGNQDEGRREQKYYRLLQKRNIDWRLLPRYYGTVTTDRGPGAIFDLVQDPDGSTSKTLEFYLGCEQRTRKHQSQLVQALADLRNYLLEQWIVTMTLKPKNIVYRRLENGAGELVVVDNIGTSDFIPLCHYLPGFARQKIRRKWQRFESYMVKLFPDNAVLRDMLNQELPELIAASAYA